MTDSQPSESTNLDRYGDSTIPWERAHELLEFGPKGPEAGFFLATVGPDSRPHTAGVGVVWYDGDLYFTSGPRTRKARNLANNSACSIAVKLPGMDLTFDGEAALVTEPEILRCVVEIYRQLGWPAEVTVNALTAPFSAPSAGPPPWNLYRFSFSSVVGVSTAEPNGATRWRFER